MTKKKLPCKFLAFDYEDFSESLMMKVLVTEHLMFFTIFLPYFGLCSNVVVACFL